MSQTDPQRALNNQDPNALARAKKHLIQVLTELKTKQDPRAGKIDPSFRFFPGRILDDPELIDWFLSEYPLHLPADGKATERSEYSCLPLRSLSTYPAREAIQEQSPEEACPHRKD